MTMDDDLVFLPVDSLLLKGEGTGADLYNWAVPIERGKTRKVALSPVSSPRKNGIQLVKPRHNVGCRTRSNEQDIALFRYKDTVYAVQADCPHAGGPLELGDIEEFDGDGSLCVKCPWHSWKIDLHSGSVLEPSSHEHQSTTVYPVRVTHEGKMYIGFKGLDAKYFRLEEMEF